MTSPPRRFVQLCEARSGSTFLISLIGSHPCVHHVDEELTGPLGHALRFANDTTDAIFAAAERRAATRTVHPHCSDGILRIGGKVHLEHANVRIFNGSRLEEPRLARLLALLGSSTPPVPLILLLRNNSLDQFLSTHMRTQPGVVTVSGPNLPQHCTASGSSAAQCARQPRVRIDDIARLVSMMRGRAARHAALRAALPALARERGVPLLLVRYEDASREPISLMTKLVYPFLGLPPAPAAPRTPFVKRITLRHRQLISNYEAVASALQAQGLGYYLRDELYT